jgi:uncharacterized membrane protein
MQQTFLTKEQEQTIVEAIATAEKQTSGEIKVHIENDCKADEPLQRAIEIFTELKMHETELHNGVIIYIAVKARKFAIYGDEGINKVVPEDFWNNVATILKSHFKNNNYAEGIAEAIHLCGEKLKSFFPHQSNDTNELSNDISFGK